MASFKSLKNSFNRVYINGVLSIYKTIKLKSYKFYWDKVTNEVLLPVPKTIYNVCFPMRTAGNFRKTRIHYFDGNAHYMWTGYTWIVKSNLPQSMNYVNNGRKNLMIPNYDGNQFLYITSHHTKAVDNNEIYYGMENRTTGVFSWTQDASHKTPYNMYCTCGVYRGGIWYTYGGGSSENHLKRYYYQGNLDFIQLSDLPKDFFDPANMSQQRMVNATAIVHKDIVHLIGYCRKENLIYDCVFDNNPMNEPTLKVIATGTGRNTWPQGSFEDNSGVLYCYTEDKMYRYDDNTDSWSVVDSNYVGGYTTDCVVYQDNLSGVGETIYRLQTQGRYRLSIAYKLQFGDEK